MNIFPLREMPAWRHQGLYGDAAKDSIETPMATP